MFGGVSEINKTLWDRFEDCPLVKALNAPDTLTINQPEEVESKDEVVIGKGTKLNSADKKILEMFRERFKDCPLGNPRDTENGACEIAMDGCLVEGGNDEPIKNDDASVDQSKGNVEVSKDEPKEYLTNSQRDVPLAETTHADTDASETKNEFNDDNGKRYRNEDGSLIPNNIYVLDGVTYKTDDNGNIYSIDGKLKPNITYKLNGNVYTTDENGRIIVCEAKPKRSPENPRDNNAQKQAGGEDRRPNDQGGHIVGRDMNGDGGIGNLVAMDSKINQSDYKRMENDIKDALDAGKDVTTKTEIIYSDDSSRPSKIIVTVTVDGKDTVYKFDNNLDGSLRDEIPENGKETVQDRLDETGGEISSIKEEYDENGNLVETTVYITYKGEDGANYRTSVVIENQ